MDWNPDCKIWVGNLAEEGNRYIFMLYLPTC
jgi:hypothetical protein